MTEELTKLTLGQLKNFKDDVASLTLPPSEITSSPDQPILPNALFKRCVNKGYLPKVAYQINRAYSETCYDACLVMIRRLAETLIIEVYEHHGIDNKIKDSNGDFKSLKFLIDEIIKEPKWNLSRNCKRGLGHMKNVGDLSAHSRSYNAHREDIDQIKTDVRVTAQELLMLAGL